MTTDVDVDIDDIRFEKGASAERHVRSSCCLSWELIGAWLFEDILLGPRWAARDFLSGGGGYVQASRPTWQRTQHGLSPEHRNYNA
jgi:hypothetical protein